MELAIASITPLDVIRIRAERMRRSFALFVKNAWPQIDPAPLIWSWHLDAMCLHLEALAKGEIGDLLINIPPGHAKSMIVSVLWPAWQWTREPTFQVLSASYEAGLATRDAVKARELTLTPWYVEHFRSSYSQHGDWGYKKDRDLKTSYVNTLGGHRESFGVGGRGTGYRGDCLIVDDPLKADDIYSQVKREEAIRWFSESMESRFNNPVKRKRVIVMQRLHEADLAAHVLKLGGWVHLNLQAEFDPNRRCVTKRLDGAALWRDPRTMVGEPLFAASFPSAILKKLRVNMGSYAYEAQFQQNPTPAEGGVIKRAWFTRRWVMPGMPGRDGYECRPVPTDFETIEMITDAAFKKTDTSDRVAIGVWGRKGPDIYLIDLVWDRMDFTETLNAMRMLKGKWKRISSIVVEDKANGSAIINVLSQELPGVVPIEPEGGKESRIYAASKYFEAGNVWLPLDAPYVLDYIEEACAFPKGAHDDAIDMSAYATSRLLTSNDMSCLVALGRQ